MSLMGVVWAVADRGRPTPGNQSAAMVFLPKGTEEGDAVEVVREASVTRPLVFDDSKLVAVVANWSVGA